MPDKRIIKNIAQVALTLLIFSSGNRHFVVRNDEFKEYGIDSLAVVDSSVVRYYMPYKK